MKSRIVVAALIKKGNKYLFGRKIKNVGPYPNTNIVIGGGANLESETIEKAIKREIKEETNITIKNLKKITFDEDYEPDKNNEMTHYIFLIYSAEYKSGKPNPGDDVDQLLWIEKKDFKKIKFSRPTVKLFKELKWL